MKVAIVNQVGFERGGATTLLLQYAKLGFNVYFKGDGEQISDKNVHFYSSKDILEVFRDYDRILFLNLWYGTTIPDTVLDDILQLHSVYPDKELCYLHCYRKTDDLDKLLPVCKAHNFMFKRIFSLNPVVRNYSNYCPCTILDINAYTLPDYSPVAFLERRNVVFSSGRTASFKNTPRYFQAIDNDFLANAGSFVYVHEGAEFTFSKTGGVGCPPQLLIAFNKTTPKTLKEQFVIKQYGEVPEHNKFNLYPSYDASGIQARWKYNYAGVCCILGTISDCVVSNFLFDNKVIVSDKRERTLIESKALNWNSSLEYADIEKIVFGVPVLFSATYADIINFTDGRLIYKSFADIPNKVNALHSYYDEVREGQYKWLVDRLKGVNENIITIFTK